MNDDLPKQAEEIFNASYEKAIADGETEKTAKRYAWQCLSLAGWVKTERGWECKGPDVRDKVTHRKAVKQPDGTYLIENVEIFYPNAVKTDITGKPIIVNEEAVRAIVDNTNRAIANGGAPTVVTVQHEKTKDRVGHGHLANFRYDDRSHAFADILGVDEKTKNEWADGAYPGVSSGIASDAKNTNLRFDHLALLPSGAPALANLPRPVIYSAGGDEFNYLCFSAADGFFTPSSQVLNKDNTMSEKLKKHAGELRKKHEMLCAALASYEAGEDGADDKYEAATKEYAAAYAAYEADEKPEDEDKKKADQYEAKKREFAALEKEFSAKKAEFEAMNAGTVIDGKSRHADARSATGYLGVKGGEGSGRLEVIGGSSVDSHRDASLTPDGRADYSALAAMVSKQVADALDQMTKKLSLNKERDSFVATHAASGNDAQDVGLAFDAASAVGPKAVEALSKILSKSAPSKPDHSGNVYEDVYSRNVLRLTGRSMDYSAASGGDSDVKKVGQQVEMDIRKMSRGLIKFNRTNHKGEPLQAGAIGLELALENERRHGRG